MAAELKAPRCPFASSLVLTVALLLAPRGGSELGAVESGGGDVFTD